MKSKKYFALLMAITLVTLALVAAQCGTPATVVVTKEVEKEVVVTKEVEKEVVVTATPGPEEEKPVSLVYMTAGDVNMLALAQNVLGPEFKEMHPNVDLRSIHTGPGNAGSRLIFEKLQADKEAGKEQGDVDLAMVHQIFMNWAMPEDMLLKYAEDLET
jgi:ABC-type glycerol-3-phosphate transport system substrate-binding protein